MTKPSSLEHYAQHMQELTPRVNATGELIGRIIRCVGINDYFSWHGYSGETRPGFITTGLIELGQGHNVTTTPQHYLFGRVGMAPKAYLFNPDRHMAEWFMDQQAGNPTHYTHLNARLLQSPQAQPSAGEFDTVEPGAWGQWQYSPLSLETSSDANLFKFHLENSVRCIAKALGIIEE